MNGHGEKTTREADPWSSRSMLGCAGLLALVLVLLIAFPDARGPEEVAGHALAASRAVSERPPPLVAGAWHGTATQSPLEPAIWLDGARPSGVRLEIALHLPAAGSRADLEICVSDHDQDPASDKPCWTTEATIALRADRRELLLGEGERWILRRSGETGRPALVLSAFSSEVPLLGGRDLSVTLRRAP
ncbi:MAG: hypothetical protein DWQ36_07120 [Acidobacteria bacterium]|nr:MAG: hypothetical protein DWQ30_24555 [Acidobacteriota bacterium]REK09312.1 MAG: hypothetical protein DWQ36_07120 [Acidobacteriota bacterium]